LWIKKGETRCLLFHDLQVFFKICSFAIGEVLDPTGAGDTLWVVLQDLLHSETYHLKKHEKCYLWSNLALCGSRNLGQKEMGLVWIRMK
jgi:hypothetical protein